MSMHIEAKQNEIADRVLLPGDPLRAKYIADNFLTKVKLVNSVRNMFAYTGYYKNNRITVMGSGMGIPSACIYTYELFKEYDVKKIIRIGTSGSNNKKIKVNDIILCESAYSLSSFPRNFTTKKNKIMYSDIELNNDVIESSKLLEISLNIGRVKTLDAFDHYMPKNIVNKQNKNKNFLACEMETFGILFMANYLNKKATSILTVSDSLYDKKSLTQKERQESLNKMIILALDSIIKN